MGASTFIDFAPGADVKVAFAAARECAQFESGHGGYSGTIAEKYDVTVIDRTPKSYTDALHGAHALLDNDDDRISDKWGPAGALRVRDDERDGWLFVGWASS